MKRRDFPIIRLTPWEHTPNVSPQDIEGRAQNVVPFEWRGRQFQLAARKAEVGIGNCLIIARCIGSNDEANWALGTGNYYDEVQLISWNARLRLAKRLQSKARSKYFPFGRLFQFEASELGTQGAYFAYVGANGSARWMGFTGYGRGEESFRLLMKGDSLLDVPALEVRAHLLAELGREDSDASFALRWHEIGLGGTGRQDLIYEVKRGSLEEMRHVLRCALCIEPIVRSQIASWSWWIPEADTSFEMDEEVVQLWTSDTPQWLSSSLRLRLWKRLALAYYRPTFKDALVRNHVCARHNGDKNVIATLDLNIHLETPTQHERIEAALFLRKWGRDKMSPRKLQLLLSGV